MEIAGFISIGVLIIVQIAHTAYNYGKLSQKVCSIDKRLNDLSYRFGKIEDRVRNLEVKK